MGGDVTATKPLLEEVKLRLCRHGARAAWEGDGVCFIASNTAQAGSLPPPAQVESGPWGVGAGQGIQAWQADGVNLPDLSGPLIRVELGWWVDGWEWLGGGGGAMGSEAMIAAGAAHDHSFGGPRPV